MVNCFLVVLGEEKDAKFVVSSFFQKNDDFLALSMRMCVERPKLGRIFSYKFLP